METPIILALDIGTSSVRAALYDGNAIPLKGMAVKVSHSFVATEDGGSEIDANEALGQVVAAIDGVLKKSSRLKADIAYVAISAFWHSIVGVDGRGRPTTRVFNWADTRSRHYSSVLRKRFDEGKVHNRTGAHFHSSYWPAKLMWLRRERGDAFAKTTRWLSFCDYVSLCLLGTTSTSISMASGTGIFDIRKCSWDAELLRYLKVKPDTLPTVVDADTRTFQLTPAYAKRWPRLRNTLWFPGVGDGAADNNGSECTTRDRAVLMIGTSGAMRIAYTGEPPASIPDGLWCYRIDRKRILIGGALSDGGGLYHWLENNLRLPKDAEAEVARRGPAADGLTFMPFLAGERSTGYHESATGVILGLRSSHDTIDILQAAMESVAYRFAEIFDRLRRVAPVREIVASGGALRDSPVWTQMIADVLGRDLTLSGVQESSSRGAVLLALGSIGKIDNVAKLSLPSAGRVAFHKRSNDAYKVSRARHRTFYETYLKQHQ